MGSQNGYFSYNFQHFFLHEKFMIIKSALQKTKVQTLGFLFLKIPNMVFPFVVTLSSSSSN